MSAASLLFVGFVASETSDRQTVQSEKQLLRNVLAHRLDLLSQEQLSLARSDHTVASLVHSFDVQYVRQSVSAQWANYGHNRTVVITGDRIIRAESFDDYTHLTSAPLESGTAIEDLFRQVQTLYMANRVRVPGGFGHRSLQSLDTDDFAVAGYTVLDNRVAMISAVPVMPDGRTTLPDGPAAVIVSAMFLDGGMLRDLNGDLTSDNAVVAELNGALAYEELKFARSMPDLPTTPALEIRGLDGTLLGAFQWQSRTQTSSIWPTVVPVIFVLSVALAILAFGIAWRIGRLNASLQLSEAQNRYLALHDSLSGLANRLQFNRALETALKSGADTPFTILQCDLDKFKAVNDTYGHAAGDEVIKAVAQRFTAAIGEKGLVARLGGDEFAVLIYAKLPRTTLRDLAVLMIRSIKEPIALEGGNTAHIGLSIGIASFPGDGKDPEALMAAADRALYASKEAGRGRAAFASDTATADAGSAEPSNTTFGIESDAA
ncbi:hypothetical protein GCM10011316_13040 [Roseibium aquae]|uniref:GGDEF domain-containing protein n=1 Tax=Roseibium aquae TaxID=1323746 RepID=A0A916TF33_9HYPH|nr:hypothetical protein GCM10011316_13040 [Roseibium aquae]